jgi:hypothetical protein
MTDAPENKHQRGITLFTGSAPLLFSAASGCRLKRHISSAVRHCVRFRKTPSIARAFGLFNTFVIAAAAVAPPLMVRVSDIMGLDERIRLSGWIALSTVLLAFVLSRPTVKLSKENQNIY